MRKFEKKTAAIIDTAEPSRFTQRIGSTIYVVSVRFSRTSKETIEDKILRLIESEVRKSA